MISLTVWRSAITPASEKVISRVLRQGQRGDSSSNTRAYWSIWSTHTVANVKLRVGSSNAGNTVWCCVPVFKPYKRRDYRYKLLFYYFMFVKRQRDIRRNSWPYFKVKQHILLPSSQHQHSTHYHTAAREWLNATVSSWVSKHVVLPLNMTQCPSRFSRPTVFSVADQSERGRIITICQIPKVYRTCNLELSSTTSFCASHPDLAMTPC